MEKFKTCAIIINFISLLFSCISAHSSPPNSPPLPMPRTVPRTNSLPHSQPPQLGLLLQQPPPPSQVGTQDCLRFWKNAILMVSILTHLWHISLGVVLERKKLNLPMSGGECISEPIRRNWLLEKKCYSVVLVDYQIVRYQLKFKKLYRNSWNDDIKCSFKTGHLI